MKKVLSFILIMSVFLAFAQETPTSFSLQEAIEYTLKNNYDVLNAQIEIEKAQKKVWETTATGLPQINATADYNYNIDIPTAYFAGQTIELGSKQSLNIGATASQLLFSGAYIVGLQSAKAYREISDMAMTKTKATLTEAVINAYAGVVIADENIKILEKNIKLAEKNFNDISAIYKEGLTEEQNVDQLGYTLTQLKTTINVAKRQKESALNSLKFLMGINQANSINLTTKLDDLMQDNLNLMQDNLNENVQQHIDYKIADHQITTSELQLKYQKTQALPTLSTSFTYQKNGFSNNKSIGSGFGEFNPVMVWGVKLQVPIFSSGARSSRTQQAKLDLEAAEINKKKVEEKLAQDVKNAQLTYQNAMENYYTNKDLVALSQKIYKKENVKFTEGISTSLDLTNAEQQLYRSQNQYIQSIFNVIQSKSTLFQALGKY